MRASPALSGSFPGANVSVTNCPVGEKFANMRLASRCNCAFRFRAACSSVVGAAAAPRKRGLFLPLRLITSIRHPAFIVTLLYVLHPLRSFSRSAYQSEMSGKEREPVLSFRELPVDSARSPRGFPLGFLFLPLLPNIFRHCHIEPFTHCFFSFRLNG